MDPVTQYAQDVTSGAVIASKLVRLACARHLRDLERSDLEFKPEKAERVIRFFEKVLCLPDVTPDGVATGGKPFVLSPFQQFIAGSLFGWYGKDGYRRYHHAYIETAKGSGKTPFGAGLLIYMCVADGERGAQCYCAAVTKDQAKLAFTDAANMVAVSGPLAEVFDQKVNNLAILDTGCFIRPISAEKRGLDGKRVHGALVDELHEHPTHEVSSKITAGTKDRRNALVLEITNSGFDRNTVCWEHHELSRQILEGVLEDDSWFGFICHLDACEKCQKAGKYQPSDECPDCDDWKVEGPHWLKANPNLGVSLQWQYLRNQVAKGVNIPSERNIVRRLNFCQWTQQDKNWIPSEAWKACESETLVYPREKGPYAGLRTLAALQGRECYIGIDPSDKIDLTSVVAIFPRLLEQPEVPQDDDPFAGVAENPDWPIIDRAIDVLTFFFMPEKTLQRRSQEDRIPYPDWARQKFVFTTPGDIIDHDALADFIIHVLGQLFAIAGIGIDQAGAAGLVNKLRTYYGYELVSEVPQGPRSLSEPSKMLEALVMSGHLAHDGNPCEAWCIGNMAIEENTWREIRPIKIDQRKRIDGGVALVDAIWKMLRAPQVSFSGMVTNLADYL